MYVPAFGEDERGSVDSGTEGMWRRSAIFLSVCLPEVREADLGLPIRVEVTGELPVRKATISTHLRGDDCCDIDYLALSASGTESVFVEF